MCFKLQYFIDNSGCVLSCDEILLETCKWCKQLSAKRAPGKHPGNFQILWLFRARIQVDVSPGQEEQPMFWFFFSTFVRRQSVYWIVIFFKALNFWLWNIFSVIKKVYLLYLFTFINFAYRRHNFISKLSKLVSCMTTGNKLLQMLQNKKCESKKI